MSWSGREDWQHRLEKRQKSVATIKSAREYQFFTERRDEGCHVTQSCSTLVCDHRSSLAHARSLPESGRQRIDDLT